MESARGAILAGRDFLLASQRPSGLWMDFRMGPGWSDEWVTGYVGDRLARVDGTREARERAWIKLRTRSRVRPVGWGYNVLVPQCADSTTWVLRLARGVDGLDTPEAERAVASLHLFRREDGLMTTYVDPEPIRAFMRAYPSRTFRGWTSSHVCVTAATAALDGIVDRADLTRCQLSDGRWHGYWWTTDTFTTALAAESLGPGPQTRQAMTWAESVMGSEDALNAFDLANLVSILTSSGHSSSAGAFEAIAALVSRIDDDGSWESGAVMRVPDTEDATPDESSEWTMDGLTEKSLIRDTRRVFTTATVVWALAGAVS